MVAGAALGQGGITTLPSFDRVFDEVVSLWPISISAAVIFGIDGDQYVLPVYQQTIGIREGEWIGQTWRLAIRGPGSLDSLKWKSLAPSSDAVP